MSRRFAEKYADEPSYPVTEGFRRFLSAWLQEERGRRKSLAEKLDIDPSALTYLVNGTVHTSRLIGPICKATKLPLPKAAPSRTDDPEWELAVYVLRAADNGEPFEHLRRMAITLADAIQKSKGK